MNGVVILIKELILVRRSSIAELAWLVKHKSGYKNGDIQLSLNNIQVS